MAIQSGERMVLKRQIGLLACFLYGVGILLPLGPVPVYGVAANVANGNIALAYLIGMVGMAFSAWTYGQMGAEFPYAGSSYTFVSKSINPYLGFLTGWAILVDYLLMPVLNYVVLGLFTHALFPALSFNVVVYTSIVLICFVNLRGIKNLTRINNIITIFGFTICFYFIYAAFVAMSHGVGTGLSSVAFYNSKTFSLGGLLTGASIAAFSYIGFDVMTTLAEETKNPCKTLPRATLLVCFVMGIIFTVFCFVSQAVFPGANFTDTNVAFLDVAKAAGGATLANAISLAVIAGAFAYSMDMLAAVSRLLLGMGRDGVLPKKIFGYVSPKTGVSVWNTIIVSALCFIFSRMTLDILIPLVNFGGLFAYICVNLSCIIHFYFKSNRREGWDIIRYLVVPGIGFTSMFLLWVNLETNVKIVGFIWLAIGIVYMEVLTK